MRFLMIGDVVGRSGRTAVREWLPRLREELGLDFVIANGDNAAGGFGISASTARELFASGVHVITTGNHTWAQKEAYTLLHQAPNILRPANYPAEAPGRGAGVFTTAQGEKVGVLHLMGNVFMSSNPLPCPFRAAADAVDRLRLETPVIFVDFHAEATSEKMALTRFLDGRVSAVVGTHTHVATADEGISPNGTACLSDVGMTGPTDSVLGMKADLVLQRFLTKLPVRYQVAEGAATLRGVVVTVEGTTGKATTIERIERR